jgi:hypothetical protein
MEISYAFFAEAAQLTGDGRVNVLGADMPALAVQGSPPWVVPVLALLARIQMDREDCGRLYHFTGQMTGPDGREVAPRIEQVFIAPTPARPGPAGTSVKVVLLLNGMLFPVAGDYRMALRVEDRERGLAQEKGVALQVDGLVPEPQPA